MFKEGNLVQHFKGGVYKILYIATDTTTMEESVVYESELDGKVWVRSLKEFSETITRPRFKVL